MPMSNWLDLWPLSFAAAALSATVLTLLLAVKSIKDFSHTGPQLKNEVLKHYRLDLFVSITRLGVWTWLIAFLLAAVGATNYLGLCVMGGAPPTFLPTLMASALSTLVITGYLFCHNLLYLPANIEASSNYRVSRLFPLWQMLTPVRLKIIASVILLTPICIWAAALTTSLLQADWLNAASFATIAVFAIFVLYLLRSREPLPAKASKKKKGHNVLMIGSDSLRADRINGASRKLTPFLDQLAKQGTHFTNCFVPCARTAPSLASLLTGTWPQRHGIRDNFVAGDESRMNGVPSMVHAFRNQGYRTVAISDWCGADFGKLNFGFEECDLPDDQWNIKYLLRQGPKDIRLFLSLFVRNQFGKRFLPEIYYLAGVPTTHLLGLDAREAISKAASSEHPFLINVFMSTTHGPFGSEYPYYTLFSGTEYKGGSKFVMSGLNEPSEIVIQQGYTKDKFDLEQIINLYDGCVRNFDDEVKRIVNHLNDCGLADSTILVIYSDHGMEFFERETWGQGNSVVVDDSARIPLIVVDPLGVQGREIPEIVRTIDLAPTLLELSGHSLHSDAFDGQSLASVIRGLSPMPELPAYYETGIWFTKIPGLSDNHLHYPDLLDLLEVPSKLAATIGIKGPMRKKIIDAKDRALRIGKWKLVRVAMQDGPKWYLYDISADPSCTQPLNDKFPEALEKLRVLGEPFWVA